MHTMTKTHPLAMELEFTEVYQRYEQAHPAIREAMCLRVQYPALLGGIREGDFLAGGFSEEIPTPGVGFYMGVNSPHTGFVCVEETLRRKLQLRGAEGSCEEELQSLLDFWGDRTTSARFWSRVIIERPAALQRALPDRLGPADVATPQQMMAVYGDRMATATGDFDKLLRLGVPGLLEEVERHRQQAASQGGNVELYDGMRMCLELFSEVCLWYTGQAEEQGRPEMAEALRSIAVRPPRTLYEAMQLFWLYSLLANITNYGRMDVYLGDFLASDLASGRISESEALAAVESLWRTIAAFCGSHSGAGRVIIGGVGRRNEEDADRFALLAMEATRRTRVVNPQLTFRCYQGMNPALMDQALSVIAEGLTFPILVNDDVSVPALQRAFGASRHEAEQHVLSNCGDVGLDHMSFGSPNSFINLAKALEVTLHNGMDPVSGLPMGLALGEFKDFQTFDDLFAAYCKQVEFLVDVIADRTQAFNEALGENPFLFLSLVSDDCLVRGRGAFAGGLRYLGGLLETYGNITTADSLTAVKQLVYDRKLVTPERMLGTLDANFQGYAREHGLMRKAPKFGNDRSEADAMAARVNGHLFSHIWRQKDRTKLDFMLGEYVNAGGNVQLGQATGATPDGRLAGQPLANAHNPSSGSDREGVTAMLNSMAKLDASLIGPGVFQNLHLNRELFASSRDQVKSLVESFLAKGGVILQVTATSRRDLEEAMEAPERHPNLVVRVGGFSARFVELDRDLQLDILQRTVY